MRIILSECKKALMSPILIVLIVLFACYNLFLIFERSSTHKEDLKVANQLAETYGLHITNESMHQFQDDLQRDLAKGFSPDLPLKEMYYYLALNIDERYSEINWEQIGEAEINQHGFSGSAAETLRKQYVKFSERFAEIKENDEHKTWFFAGNPYGMHSFLYRTVFGHIVFESLLIIVLATALISNFEFEQRTHLVTYTTKRGRRLMMDKLAASLLTATAVTAFLLGVTLGAYFIAFDYSYLWGSSISSALNWEYRLPYVSKWPMSFSLFLVWSILLVYVCMLLFTAITFVISVFVKNNYFTFFVFGVFLAIAYMLPSFMPLSSPFIFIAGYNLSQLVLNPHMFFMGNSGSPMMFEHYELITVCSWTAIVVAFCLIARRKFNNEDIH